MLSHIMNHFKVAYSDLSHLTNLVILLLLYYNIIILHMQIC